MRRQTTAALGTVLVALMSCGLAAAEDRNDRDDAAHRVKTDTPIKHLIVLIGENRTFDHIFATYQPKHGQSVANLLSKGMILPNGAPGPNFAQSRQFQINQPYPSKFFIDAFATAGKTAYQQSPGTPLFPAPNTAYVPSAPGGLDQGQAPFSTSAVPDSELPTIEPSLEHEDLGLLRTGASGLPMFSTDTRVPNFANLRNGLFPISGPPSRMTALRATWCTACFICGSNRTATCATPPRVILPAASTIFIPSSASPAMTVPAAMPWDSSTCAAATRRSSSGSPTNTR